MRLGCLRGIRGRVGLGFETRDGIVWMGLGGSPAS